MKNKNTNVESNFYLLRHKPSYKSRFAWAFTIVPRLSEIGELCDVCGKGRWYPSWYPERPLSVIIGKGKTYPDILGCGAYPLLILSERVLTTWDSLGLGSYSAYPMNIISEPAGKRPTPPPYYHVKITGRCQLDLEAMGLKVIYRCPKCDYSEVVETKENDPRAGLHQVIKPETWDGSDVFVADINPRGPFCTGRVAALAERNKWTNFRFDPSDYDWLKGTELGD
jgi:hypothetical protein